MQATHLESHSAIHGTAAHSGIIRWNAIIAGSLVTLAIWAMLYTLGIALGLSAISQDSATSLKASGIFTGAWSVLSPLIALFSGAVFTSRGAAAHTRAIGAMHGLVMWSLSTLGFAWLFVTLLSNVVDGAVGASKHVLSLGGQGVVATTQGAGSLQNAAANAMGTVSDNVGIDMQDVLRSLNVRLKASGRSPIEPDMLSRALKDLVKSGLRQGKIDKQDIIEVVLNNTPLERQDAEEVSEQVQARIEASKGHGKSYDGWAHYFPYWYFVSLQKTLCVDTNRGGIRWHDKVFRNLPPGIPLDKTVEHLFKWVSEEHAYNYYFVYMEEETNVVSYAFLTLIEDSITWNF